MLLSGGRVSLLGCLLMWPKATWEKNDHSILRAALRSHFATVGSQGEYLEAGTEAEVMVECCLLASSSWPAQPASLDLLRAPVQEFGTTLHWYGPANIKKMCNRLTGRFYGDIFSIKTQHSQVGPGVSRADQKTTSTEGFIVGKDFWWARHLIGMMSWKAWPLERESL